MGESFVGAVAVLPPAGRELVIVNSVGVIVFDLLGNLTA